MNKYPTETTAPDKPAPVAPATNWLSVIRFAILRTFAVAVFLATVISGLYLIGQHWTTGNDDYLIAAGIVALIGFTFAATLWAATSAFRRTLWGVEAATGRDLDRDGTVGRPKRRRFRLVPVMVAGRRQDPVGLDLDNDDDPADDWLEGFELSVLDVRAFVIEAGQRGLQLG